MEAADQQPEHAKMYLTKKSMNGRVTQVTDFERERNSAILRSTDFASKGLYKDTTTGGTKSQSVFKDVANLRLAGNTFDAKHMDKFLNNKFCLSSSPSQVKLGQTKNQYSPTRMSPLHVRQSSSFITIDREHKGQQRIYIDQYDGASSLLKRDDHMTTKEATGGEKNLYDYERDQIQNIDRDITNIQRQLYQDDGQLKTSKQKYIESVQLKNELKRFQEEKAKYMFVGKRDRLMKTGWRHGVLGVENPDDPGTDIYRDQQIQRNYQQDEKCNINQHRYKKLVKNGEVSSQVDFGRSGMFNETRRDERLVEMYPEWKSKGTSPMRFQDTHQDIFVPLNCRVNPLRSSKLKLEEKRDRPYNIITGDHESII